MSHGSPCKFDSSKELIKDFCERFEFYCVANNILDDAAWWKKALFLTLLGQATFAKLNDLASSTPISELTLDEIIFGRPLSPTIHRNNQMLQGFQEKSSEVQISHGVYGSIAKTGENFQLQQTISGACHLRPICLWVMRFKVPKGVTLCCGVNRRLTITMGQSSGSGL